MLLSCGVGEDFVENPLDWKEIQPVHPKGDQSWVFIGRTDVEAETPVLWCKELTHLKRPWCWERLRAGGEGDDRGWDGWMASPTQQIYYLGWNRSPAQVGCMRQVLRAGALGRPRGIGWGGRREGGSGWGTHVNPWLIHFSVWQNPLQ